MEIDHYLGIKTTKKHQNLELKEIFNRIRKKNINTPKSQRAANVFSSRTTKGRKHEHLKEFTGLMFMDIDDCKDHVQVKDVFINLSHCYATWYSSSGKNVHALIRIPISKDIAQYKRRFLAFMKLVKPFIEDFATIDKITVNPSQLAFESYDPEIHVREDAVVFDLIMPPERKKKIEPIEITPTHKKEEWCIKWIHSEIAYISHPGYTQLLNYSKSLGGYCSGGYINRDIALYHLEAAINNNQYLNSSESSGSMATYQKGAKSAFEAGLSEPIEWKKK